jgi:hypothetical protein
MSSKITTSDLPVKGAIAPQSVAAAGNATSGWIDASDGTNIITVVNGGALGGGTVALSFEQATDNAGTGAKAVSSAAVGAGLSSNNTQFQVDNAVEKLDHNNGFKFFRAKLTVTGGTGALIGATVHLGSPRYLA